MVKTYHLVLVRDLWLEDTPLPRFEPFKEVAVSTRTKNIPEEKQIESVKLFAKKLNPDFDIAIEFGEMGKAIHNLFTSIRPSRKKEELTDFDRLMAGLFIGSPEDYERRVGKADSRISR